MTSAPDPANLFPVPALDPTNEPFAGKEVGTSSPTTGDGSFSRSSSGPAGFCQVQRMPDLTPPPPAVPASPVLTLPPSATTKTSVSSSGTAAPNSTIRIDNNTNIVAGTTDASGAFSLLVPLTANRLNRMFATVGDAKGSASAPVPFDVLPDAQAPNLFIDFPTNGMTLTVSNSVIAGRVGDLLDLRGTPGMTNGIDSDGDGLPDAGEIAHGLNPFAANNANLDSDVDGFSDREEFLSGTDPQEASSKLQIQSVEVISGAAGNFMIRFTAEPGRTYTIEYRDGAAPGLWRKLEDVPPEMTRRVVAVADSALREKVTRYFRVLTPVQS